MVNNEIDVSLVGDYDVIVCGGGTSGLAAAVASAKQGAKVAIIERYGFLGGTVAFSIMPCWHGLIAHHSGLLTEFANRVEEIGVGPAPLKDGNHIEPEVVKYLFLKMAEENNIDLYLHNFIVDVIKKGDKISSIITESKSGRRAFNADIFIDATGDGDLCYLAGADYMKGVDGKTQAMSLRFRIGYINYDAFIDWADKHPRKEELKLNSLANRKNTARKKRPFHFPSRIDKLYDEYRDQYPDLPYNTYFNCSSIRPNELSINSTRVYDLDGSDADDLSKAEVITRKQAWEIWRFLKDNVPGFEDSVIIETAPQVGIRESRCIVGDYVLKVEDGAANRTFDDSVQTCRVSFDSHDKNKYETGGNKGLVDVPYRCFLPKGLDGVLVVGRAASCDHLMNSAFRRMENSFTSGEVAGTAAGMSIKETINPRELKVEKLQTVLKKNGVKISQSS